MQFILRQIRLNERLALTETALDIVTRADRERNAYTFATPGRNGAHVFEWVDSVRTYVTRARVPDVWPDYARTQKWYNPVRNEWDLCRELHPSAVLEEDDEDEDDGYNGVYAADMPLPSIEKLGV